MAAFFKFIAVSYDTSSLVRAYLYMYVEHVTPLQALSRYPSPSPISHLVRMYVCSRPPW